MPISFGRYLPTSSGDNSGPGRLVGKKVSWTETSWPQSKRLTKTGKVLRRSSSTSSYVVVREDDTGKEYAMCHHNLTII